jgi:hypothetical protein
MYGAKAPDTPRILALSAKILPPETISSQIWSKDSVHPSILDFLTLMFDPNPRKYAVSPGFATPEFGPGRIDAQYAYAGVLLPHIPNIAPLMRDHNKL